MPTRRQHYVWRHYLEGWQAPDKLVASLIGDKLTRTRPSNIMVQRDFYRIGALTSADVATLRALLVRDETSPALRDLHRQLIKQFHRLATLGTIAQADPRFHSRHKRLIRDAVIQAEERLHGGIEQRAMPILRALRNEDPGVMHDTATSVDFFNFLSHQYFRTKAIRDAMSNGLRALVPADTAERIRHVFCHCIATNVGASLYGDRHHFELLFLRSPTPQGLITGDQPVVNLLATHDGDAPAEVAFYYPLTPSLAMILSPKSLDLRPAIARVAAPCVRELNDLIAWKSVRFLVARSASFLCPYISPAAVPPSSPLELLRGRPRARTMTMPATL